MITRNIWPKSIKQKKLKHITVIEVNIVETSLHGNINIKTSKISQRTKHNTNILRREREKRSVLRSPWHFVS